MLKEANTQVGWRVLSPNGSSNGHMRRHASGRHESEGACVDDHDGSVSDSTQVFSDMEEEGDEGASAADKGDNKVDCGKGRKMAGGEDDDTEQREERQRGFLLQAALKEAKGVLLAALGEAGFADLYSAVMQAEGGGAGVGKSWSSDRHGWQMLQYIYLEEEILRIRHKYA